MENGRNQKNIQHQRIINFFGWWKDGFDNFSGLFSRLHLEANRQLKNFANIFNLPRIEWAIVQALA